MTIELESEIDRVFCACDGSEPTFEEKLENLRKAPIESLNPLLFHMIRSRSLPLLTYLIELGADVDYSQDGGITPLHYACQCGGIEMAQFLVKSGALRLTLCERGFDILTYAVLSLSLPMVKWACSQGCDPNHRNRMGMSVLHAAVGQANRVDRESEICEILEYLIQKGARIEPFDRLLPWQIAEGNNLHQAAKILRSISPKV